MAWILGEYKYIEAIPILKKALKDEYKIFSKEGVVYPVWENAKSALKKLGVKVENKDEYRRIKKVPRNKR